MLRTAFDAEMVQAEIENSKIKPAARLGSCEYCGKPPAGCKGNADHIKCSTHNCPNFASRACFVARGRGDSICFDELRDCYTCEMCRNPAGGNNMY